MLKQFEQFMTESIFDSIKEPIEKTIQSSLSPSLWISENEYYSLSQEDCSQPTEFIYSGILMKQDPITEEISDFFVELYKDRLVGHFNNQIRIIYLETVKLIHSDNIIQEEDELLFFLLYSQKRCEILFCEKSTDFNNWLRHLKPVCILNSFQNSYTFQKVIGRGTFAKVLLCTRISDQKKFAVKLFDKKNIKKQENSLKRIKALLNEIKILRSISHPNIIQLYEVYEGKEHLYLVMELLSGGELFKKIAKYDNFTESIVRNLMRNLLQALDYLHAKNIMHRDIKPENIIVRNNLSEFWDIVVADFGLSEIADKKDLLYQKCGTPGYVAPEILANEKYSTQVDIFSAGVIMYIMLTGKQPFNGETYAQMITQNKKCEVNYNFSEIDCKLSQNAEDLLRKLLDQNPQTRLTANNALKHPWFQEKNQSLSTKLHNESMSKLIEEQQQLQKNKPQNLNDSQQMMMQTPIMNQTFTTATPMSNSPCTPGSDILSPPSNQLQKKSKLNQIKQEDKEKIKEIIFHPSPNHKTLKSIQNK